jgi:hypothetical protein
LAAGTHEPNKPSVVEWRLSLPITITAVFVRAFTQQAAKFVTCRSTNITTSHNKEGDSPSELLQPVLHFVQRALWFLKSQLKIEQGEQGEAARLFGKDAIFFFLQAGYVHLPTVHKKISTHRGASAPS